MDEQKNLEHWGIALLAITLFILSFNSYQIGVLRTDVQSQSGSTSLQATGSSVQESTNNYQTVSTTPQESIVNFSKGVPEIYGKELGVSFDDVSVKDPTKADNTISILGALDDKITLTAEQKERYIKVLYKDENGISCEYCCGARAVIFENGEAACGCAHSYAMRGLTKYLITKHGAEYTDEQLLAEAGKWKMLFFPSAMEQKAQVLKNAGIELNPITLASNKYRGAEQQATTSTSSTGSTGGSTMVGGC